MRTSTKALATVAAGAAIFAAGAPAATADHSGPLKPNCSGTQIDHRTLKNSGGGTIGRVELWYDGSKPGGQNCVKTYTFYPGKSYTGASLGVDTDGDRKANRYAYDEGWYSSYAGATFLNHTAGKCVQWGGLIYGPNEGSHADDDSFKSKWRHCG